MAAEQRTEDKLGDFHSNPSEAAEVAEAMVHGSWAVVVVELGGRLVR